MNTETTGTEKDAPEMTAEELIALGRLRDDAGQEGRQITFDFPPSRPKTYAYLKMAMFRLPSLLSMARRTAEAEEKLKAAEERGDRWRKADLSACDDANAVEAEVKRLREYIATHAGDTLSLQGEIDALTDDNAGLQAEVERLTGENKSLQRKVDLWYPKADVAGSWGVTVPKPQEQPECTCLVENDVDTAALDLVCPVHGVEAE